MLNILFLGFYKLGTESSKKPGGICFWLWDAEVRLENYKSNCVVLIHVRNSLPSNILILDFKNASTQFLCSEDLFCVFSFLKHLCWIHKKRKKDFISLLLSNKMPLGKSAL